MNWFSRPKYTTLSAPAEEEKRELPQGVWTKCDKCHEYLTNKQIHENLKVCVHCDNHFRLTAPERVGLLADEDSFHEIDPNLESCDPLGFQRYQKKVAESQQKTGLKDAILSGTATLNGHPVVLAVTDFSFIGGSMGSVVGERVTRAMEYALAHRLPLISVAAGGGGARMQEGTLSLMQMAKTSAAVGRLHAARVPFISIFTHPTMGGVAASYASLGDVALAEPGALIGFTGPRVIEQTIGQRLPAGFQTSEFLLEHGMIDMIVDRRQLKDTLAHLVWVMTANAGGTPAAAATEDTAAATAAAREQTLRLV